MENLADDPDFISAIVQEVKSQGLFDQFRKECLADVDTKPAYQNLRQRVESSVAKFLGQQTWTDNIRHKNQLRDKLRKHIIESGFLDTGVERIVDQVVNPKISTVFHPKIEEIVYNYLGIEKPQPVLNGGTEMEVQTDFLPEDLEAVSPDSDKKSSSTSSDIAIKPEPNANDGELNESKEIVEDFESPAFEPLETRPPSQVKNESNDSHASAISGLTSQDSVGSGIVEFKQENSVAEDEVGVPVNGVKNECNVQDEEPSDEASRPPLPEISPEVTQNDSQLSQVSSNSRLSIITSSEGVLQQQQQLQQNPQAPHNPRLDITEEAQMPKFNENSNEEEGELPESGGDEEPSVSADGGERGPHKSNFDLRKESYEFKGTERSKRYLDVDMEKSNAVESASAEDTVANAEVPHKEEPQNEHEDQPKNSVTSLKYEENSTHSETTERSLRICEDSTLEQKAAAQDTCTSLQENCESVKTPLNDEHSTHSAPDVDKMDSTQVAEVVSLAAVQQHSEKEKKSSSDRHHRDRDHKSRSSSSRDRRSHSSSKQGSGSSSGSGSSNRKSDHRDRKGENGNGSNHGSSKRSSGEKRRDDDDHYSSHEKPVKKRRSTDRDSNDGAENGKSSNAGGENNGSSGKGTNRDSAKSPQNSQKRGNGPQDKLNESLESSFEGFDEEQLGKKERKSITPKKSDKGSKTDKGLTKSGEKGKSSKKPRKSGDKSPPGKSVPMTMDVFSFSFDKPAKLVNGEIVAEISPEPADELREEVDAVPSQESIGNFDGEIVLDPAELEQAISANQNAESQQQVTSSVDDNALETVHTAHSFPTTDPADLVTLASQPIVVDQMLSNGDNMDLELLIGEKQLRGDESTMDTIQKGLDVVKNKNKIRKPKIASNFSEACKLMKVRRQIERQEKKKREQAMVMAKKLINENGSAMEEDQGIELEFVCDSTRNNSAPIISSPVRQKSKLNNCLDEQNLLYFPEESEVFPVNEKLCEFLKQKTKQSTFAADFVVECMNIKLYSLEGQKESTKALIPEAEEDEVMAVEITEVDDISSENCSVVLERINMDSPKWQKLRAPSVDSDGANSHEDTVSSLEVPSNGVDENELTQAKPVEEPTNETKVSDEPADTRSLPTVRAGGIKSRRVGLSRPKGATLNNNTTAILKVDIADVKPPGVSPAADQKSGSDIKEQRYTASDLYKPTLNGLRTRTRTRTSEGFSM